MEGELQNAVQSFIQVESNIEGVIIVDKYGFEIYNKNFKPTKAAAIKTIADMCSIIQDQNQGMQQEFPNIVIETTGRNLIVKNAGQYYIGVIKNKES